MKILIYSILLLIPTLSLGQRAKIAFEKTTFNMGLVQENGGKVTHEFKFTNKGKAPLLSLIHIYNYDPRVIVETVQRGNEEEIEELLKSDTIWYCGECMSCKTRCPRCNTPGLVIMALRKISQELGYFVYSEKGRQQYALKHVVGESILKRGYCVTPDLVKPEMHPEQGDVYKRQM